jgi:IS30 family transposase
MRLSESEKSFIAQRFRAGAPVRGIARVMGRPVRTVRTFLKRLRESPRRVRARSPQHLSLVEREEISRGLVEGCSLRVIASRLGRKPSTVCREVNRNGGRRRYRAAAAEDWAWACGRRPKTARLASCAELREVVEGKLRVQWSPQQISRWLPTEFPSRAEMRVSHETIYLSLFIQGRGALRKELAHELRRGHVHRRPRGYSPMSGQGRLRNTVHISERPAEAEDRAVPGHWDGDLLLMHVLDVHRHPGRAALQVRHAGQDPGPADLVGGRRGVGVEDPNAARVAVPVVDVGSRQGDGRAREVHHRQRCPGVLLRPAQPLAARQQREHQRVCCFSTSRKASPWPRTPKPTWTRSPTGSTDALDKPSTG